MNKRQIVFIIHRSSFIIPELPWTGTARPRLLGGRSAAGEGVTQSLCFPRFWFCIRPGCKKLFRFPATAIEGGLFGRIGDRHHHEFSKSAANRFVIFFSHESITFHEEWHFPFQHIASLLLKKPDLNRVSAFLRKRALYAGNAWKHYLPRTWDEAANEHRKRSCPSARSPHARNPETRRGEDSTAARIAKAVMG